MFQEYPSTNPEPTFTVRIRQDPDSMSPRECDNLGKIVHWHRRYDLGERVSPDWEPPEGAFVLPVYMIDHSGIALNTEGFGCPWDSGQVGWIYVTREDAAEAFGWNVPLRMTAKRKNTVTDALRAEIKVYSQYLSGECFGFEIEGTDGSQDSCWGFIGEDGTLSAMIGTAVGRFDPYRETKINAFKDAWARRYDR